MSISLYCHFRLGFVTNLHKLALVPSQVMFHLRGLLTKPGVWIEMIVHAAHYWASHKSQFSAFDR